MSSLDYYLFFRKPPSDSLAAAYTAYTARLENAGYQLDGSCKNNTQTFLHPHARIKVMLETMGKNCAQDLAHRLLQDQEYLVPLLAVQQQVLIVTVDAVDEATSQQVNYAGALALETLNAAHRADIFCTDQLAWYDLTYSHADLRTILGATRPITLKEYVDERIPRDENEIFAKVRDALFQEDEIDEDDVPTGIPTKISATARGTLWCSAVAFTISLAPQSAAASPWVEFTGQALGLF